MEALNINLINDYSCGNYNNGIFNRMMWFSKAGIMSILKTLQEKNISLTDEDIECSKEKLNQMKYSNGEIVQLSGRLY